MLILVISRYWLKLRNCRSKLKIFWVRLKIVLRAYCIHLKHTTRQCNQRNEVFGISRLSELDTYYRFWTESFSVLIKYRILQNNYKTKALLDYLFLKSQKNVEYSTYINLFHKIQWLEDYFNRKMEVVMCIYHLCLPFYYM